MLMQTSRETKIALLGDNPTEQDVFDFVAAHLYKQGRPAKDDKGSCVYRNPLDKTECAIGCLIPEHMYNQELEGNTIYGIVANVRLSHLKLPSYFYRMTLAPNEGLLAALQDVHDKSATNFQTGMYKLPALTQGLEEVAFEFNLKFDRTQFETAL